MNGLNTTRLKAFQADLAHKLGVDLITINCVGRINELPERFKGRKSTFRNIDVNGLHAKYLAGGQPFAISKAPQSV